MANLIFISILSYLLGSIPVTFLIVKLLVKKDVRKSGSKNVGATNAYRTVKEAGKKKLAILTFLTCWILDMVKGALPFFLLQRYFFVDFNLAMILAGFFVVLGHNYSIFLKFTGGRGAACLMGILLYLNPVSLLVWALPVLVCAIPAQIILEKKRKIEKINWKKPLDVLMMIIGGQMAGRMAGLILAPFFLYLYSPQIFLPVAGGTILLLIKNITRFRDYFKEIYASK